MCFAARLQTCEAGENFVLAAPNGIESLLPIVNEERIDDHAVVSGFDESRKPARAFDVTVLASNAAFDVIRERTKAHRAFDADARQQGGLALRVRTGKYRPSGRREHCSSHAILSRKARAVDEGCVGFVGLDPREIGALRI